MHNIVNMNPVMNIVAEMYLVSPLKYSSLGIYRFQVNQSEHIHRRGNDLNTCGTEAYPDYFLKTYTSLAARPTLLTGTMNVSFIISIVLK